MKQFHTVTRLWIELSDLLKVQYPLRGLYAHNGREYDAKSDAMFRDVMGMVADLPGCAPTTEEDLQLCFRLMVEKYKL